MKLKPLLSFILFATFFVANAQQNNIPSDQKLYIDFNGSTSDNSLSGLSPYSQNISFEVDRNNNPLRAGRLGGCADLSYANIPDNNPHQMDFTTGGTVTLWAKPDLNNSMNPADGSCITNGRHTLFSKGGDGFNTPPGISAYTSINNGVQTIGFGASANSGNFEDTFTMPYTDTWHHYAFVFTTTNLKVYVDGVLKRNVAINLSFTETNNQSLYIGTLGPKNTPALGITYWFPFGGLMDEFRLFTKSLTAAEVTDVFNESYDMIAPAVRRMNLIGESGAYYSSFVEEVVGYQGNDIFVVNRNYSRTRFPGGSSSRIGIKSIDNSGNLTWEVTLHTFSCYQSSTAPYLSICDQVNHPCIGMASSRSFPIKNNSEIAVEVSGNGACGKFYIINSSNGNIIFEKDYIDEHAISIFEQDSFYYVLVQKYQTDPYVSATDDFKVYKYDSFGNEVQSIDLQGSSIQCYSWSNTNGLLLTGNSKTYIISTPSLSYSQLSTSGRMCKWVGNNFIISDDNHTYRISPSFSYTQLANSFRNVDLLNNGGYVVHAANNIQNYNSTHILQNTINGISTEITLLPFSNNLLTRSTQDVYSLYDLSGNLMWQIDRNSPYYSLNFSEQDDLSFFVTQSTQLYTDVFKYTSLGNLLWKNRFATSGSIKFLNNLSVDGKRKFILPSLYFAPPFGTPSNYLYLGELATDTLPCDFSITSNLKDNYCKILPNSYDYNTVESAVGGKSIFSIYRPNVSGLSYNSSLKWYLDDDYLPTNSGFYGNNMSVNITDSGIYKLIVRQGVCEKSLEKAVNVSEAFNPAPPILSASFNPICDGDSTTITATSCAGSIEWNSINYSDRNGNVAKVYPSISTDYTANCYVGNSQYGNCRSANSTPFTVNVTTLPEVISLAGNSPLNATYRAERINSQQNVIINGAIDYKSKNAIVLNPGFSTESNAVFNAKIVSSCIE